MSVIRTPNFEVATYEQGDPGADRLAIVLPGRLDTKDYVHIRSHVDFLASIGYYSLSFDPPGTWESPGSIDLYTTTNIQKAIGEIITKLGNRPTIIAGHSRGGSHALLSGVTNPHITHMIAIMSHAGPSTVGLPAEGESAHSTRDVPPGAKRTKERKEFDLPYSYFKDQAQYDALEALKTCTKPKLFFYGTHDVLVTPASVKEIYANSADPKVLHELVAQHDYRLDARVIDEVNYVMKDFLKRYEAL